jgi:hypothetical protein
MPAAASSLARDLADQLFRAVRELAHLPGEGARDLPVMRGLNKNCTFEVAQENVIAQAIQLLQQSRRIFLYGNSIAIEVGRFDGGGQQLATLRTGHTIEPHAEHLLANLFVCEAGSKQFPPPSGFVKQLLMSDTLCPSLPRVNVYASRPLFDRDFVLRGPGWHPGPGVLIHGPAIEPVLHVPPVVTDRALDRLPLHLRTLLGGFCFRTDADVANAVAMFLTGLLVEHFVIPGKAIMQLDGNQPSTGKTLLARLMAAVLDGAEPALVFYTTEEEELQKRTCASLRGSRSSVLLFDNAKTASGVPVSSPMIESLSVAPEVAFRILGLSQIYTRPNDLLWVITMNNTLASPDLISRGVPVQLFHEGRPEDRVFTGPNPIEYAAEHRLEILGELAGMVIRWNQQGRPSGRRSHRLLRWAHMIGGMLQVAGLPEFLDNARETAATFNTATDELAAIAEAVVAGKGPIIDQSEDD